MKDKQKNKYSMNDIYNKYKNSDIVSAQSSIQDDNITEYTLNLEQVKEYNDNVTNIDPLYSEVTPINNYIVRVYVNEPEISEAGILIPYKQIVQIPTQNGMASLTEVETPYPYSHKAVIVSTPVHSTFLKKGDIVQLGNNPVKTTVSGNGKNAITLIPSAYLHPSYNSPIIPEDITSKHYGYLLVPLNDIIAKLK